MVHDEPNASYFRPPTEAHNIFADLAQDEGQDEEESAPRPSHVPPQTPWFVQEGRTLPRLDHSRRHAGLLPKIPTLSAHGRLPPKALRGVRPPSRKGNVPSATESDDDYAFPLPARYQPSYAQASTASRLPEFSAFESQKDKKKAKQIQRVRESEEALRKFLIEFPTETRLLAKVPQLEKYKQKLNGSNEVLNSGEANWVYEVSRAVERRRVVIETKAFEKRTKADMERMRKKRKRRDTSSSSSSDSESTPPRPSTGGKSIPGYIAQGCDGYSGDSDDDQDVRPGQKGQKTIAGYDGAKIPALNTERILAEASKSRNEVDTDSDDVEDSGDDENSDASAESESESESEAEAEAEAEAGEEA